MNIDHPYCVVRQYAPAVGTRFKFLKSKQFEKMDFAKGVLEKYGWKDGDGLGKEKQGIRKPIKANLKFDQAGLGADPSKEFTNNWWDRCFNDAAQNIKVKKRQNGEISVKLKDAENSVEVTTKTYSVKKLKESGSMYGTNFLYQDASDSSFSVPGTKPLTDEELFLACGGRTAHKGARHGLRLSGKLARLEQQEKELLAKIQGKTDSPNQTNDAKRSDRQEELKSKNDSARIKDSEKRLKRDHDDCTNTINENVTVEESDETNLTTKSHKKKKKKKKNMKRIRLNESEI